LPGAQSGLVDGSLPGDLRLAIFCDKLHCSRIVMQDRYPPQKGLWRGEIYRHSRIRVAYLSADLRAHPVGILMAGVFEHHDRTRFETIAISHGLDDASSADPHEIYIAHGIALSITPPETPANDRPIISYDNVFEIEMGVRCSCDRLPQRHTRCAPHMACAIGRWGRVLDDAVLDGEVDLIGEGVSVTDGAATAVGWSQYVNQFLTNVFGVQLPSAFSNAPEEGGICNVPAIILIVMCSLLLIRGVSESAKTNAIMVAIKICVLIMFIVIGFMGQIGRAVTFAMARIPPTNVRRHS
jgi:hypothetical protein